MYSENYVVLYVDGVLLQISLIKSLFSVYDMANFSNEKRIGLHHLAINNNIDD